MIGFQVFEWGISFVEVLLGILTNAKVATDGRIRWKESVFASALVAGIAWVINQIQLFSFVATIVGIVGIAAGAYFVYRVKWTDAFVISSAYLLLIYIIDFLTVSILAVVFQDEHFVKTVVSSYSIFRVGLLILSKSILFAVYWWMARKVFIVVAVRLWKVWLGLIIGSLCVYYLAAITFFQADRNILLIWSLVLFVIFLGGYSFFQYSVYAKQKDELRFVEERNKLLTENIQSTIQSYRNNQIFYHDLKNHHLVIENYLKNHEYEKATAYMVILKTMEQETTPKNWTGIETLDILMECKKRAAEENGISVIIISDQIHLKMGEQEIVALFGNLFDNAIEACQRIDMDKRWVRLVIRSINNMLFIKVSNSVVGMPCVKGSELVSQKGDSNLHGWGIKSIKAIVEKYEGDLQIDFSQETFSVLISFFN